MPLTAGQSISFYEILRPLGAGGMGEVYHARDTRLERDVAIKVLPEELADDEERLLRFEREARTLASLNHPNVAAIYGVDQVEDVCFLALELVPGEDLAQLLERGPIPIEEALDVGRQIAEGLEAAHEASVIHRDLKPANVIRTPDGVVKVLDFGLAKSQDSRDGASSKESVLRTEEGLVLGTPTYMAPEQARGRPVDRRVDVWAFGCVLFECLAGRRAFDGATVSDVIGAVLEREPDWDALPARTPPRVRELVERCLAKDPRSRLRDMGDARLELERALEERAWSAAAPTGERAGGLRSSWTSALAFALGILIGGLLLREVLTGDPAPPRQLRLSIDMRVPYQETYPRIAPGGEAVVHEGLLPAPEGEPAVRALFRRDLDDFDSVPIPGTEHPTTFCFSPDGEHLAVLVELSGRGGEQTLVRVPLRGEAPTVRLGAWPRQHRSDGGIAWLSNGLLVGTADPDQLILFSLAEGTAELRPIVRAFERPGNGIDVFRTLGDGRHVLGRTYYYGERGYLGAAVAVDVETGEEKVLVREGEYGALAADGRLLFTRGDTLFATAFDAERLEVTGAATPLADGLRTGSTWQAAWFDLARDGTLIWLPGGRQGTRRHLSVLERSGDLTPLWPERLPHDGILVSSPDGTFFTCSIVSADGQRVEIWGSETERPNLRRLLAAPGTDFVNGLPLPGGRGLIYQRISKGGDDGIFRVSLDAAGEPELLLAADPDGPDLQPVALSPAADLLVVGLEDEDGMLFSTVPLPDADASLLAPLARTPRDTFWPKLSADGSWIAYVAEEVDRSELIVQAFRDRAALGPKRAVPTPDGQVPWDFVWSQEPDTGALDLLMVDSDRRSVYSVPLEDTAAGTFGAPRRITTIEDGYIRDMTPLADGHLLLLLQDPEEEEMDRIGVVIGALAGD